MMMENVETQKDIDRLMQELNYFHDYVVLHIEYTSGTAILSDGMYPLASERNIIVKLGTYVNGIGKLIELHFKKVSRMDLIPIDERYDSLIVRASLNLNDGNIVFSDSDNTENSQTLMIISKELEIHFCS